MTTETELETLYVNTAFRNEVTLGATMQEEIDCFGQLTWRQLIDDVLHRSLHTSRYDDLKEWLESDFGITPNQLDSNVDADGVDKWRNEIAFDWDNFRGGEARAFRLICSLGVMPTDKDGNGCFHGIELVQETANGCRKIVVIENIDAANWLISESGARGVRLQIVFV
jgi:hypothetical protein